MSQADSHSSGEPKHVEGMLSGYVRYSDSTYVYHCEAKPRTSLTAAKWRITRVTTSTARREFTANYENWSDVATSVGVVAALSYS